MRGIIKSKWEMEGFLRVFNRRIYFIIGIYVLGWSEGEGVIRFF